MDQIEQQWGSYDANVYYSPENCGLRIIADQDIAGSYEFDIVLLVEDVASGRMFMVHDSGCSCPTPFEEVRGLADLVEVRSVEDVDRFFKTNTYDWNTYDEAMFRRAFLNATSVAGSSPASSKELNAK